MPYYFHGSGVRHDARNRTPPNEFLSAVNRLAKVGGHGYQQSMAPNKIMGNEGRTPGRNQHAVNEHIRIPPLLSKFRVAMQWMTISAHLREEGEILPSDHEFTFELKPWREISQIMAWILCMAAGHGLLRIIACTRGT
jgi:hypothetical protein